jgi:glycosyltransferase involved in cell wall biosynthesis
MCDTGKPRLLWIEINSFDISVNKAPRLETMAYLSRDFDVHFLTAWSDSRPALMLCGHPIEYFPQIGRGLIQKISRRIMMRGAACEKIAHLKPNIILLNCLNNFGMIRSVWKASYKIGCKTLLDVRTLPTCENTDPAWKTFENSLRFASYNFDGITYITEEMKRYCIKRYELPEHLSVIWSSGVNEELFQYVEKSFPDDEPFRLIYHGGSICISRGLDRLIQSIDRVRDIDVQLILISSKRETAVIEWINRLNLKDRIDLVETIPHESIPMQIQRCHAGILPFPNRDVWNTSSPIKLFEYLACGKPVIVTDIPAHRNVLEQNPFAFFSSDASPDSLAGAIRCAYAARGSFTELGKMARQQALKFHTWARQAENLGTFLKDILGKGSV